MLKRGAPLWRLSFPVLGRGIVVIAIRMNYLRLFLMVAVAGLIGTCSALLVDAFFVHVVDLVGCDEFPKNGIASQWYMVILIGPAIETLILSCFISLASNFVEWKSVSLCSAIFWSLLHGFFCVLWGVVVFIPFLIDSLIYMFVRKRFSFGLAFLCAMAVHSIYNFFSFIIYLYR